SILSITVFGENQKPIRVLSIDGGGVRGIIPAVVLREIEAITKQPIASTFDMVVGTSTAGIIALALPSPAQDGKPLKTAAEVVEMYIEESVNIFRASFAHSLQNLWGLIGPKYEIDGLASLLERELNDTKLSEAIIPIILTAYHIEGQTGVEFSSEE